eukprot:TRINITY_DN5585_c0_g1_i2.p1 TRINITY_DN5585_c0_g1~~TRINITY_DN5585_c0_g1_i2.p1  ORF type:complete len:191 (-),score=14.73 TRINITY_DN5585_c0_g1_i2:102-674(-)
MLFFQAGFLFLGLVLLSSAQQVSPIVIYGTGTDDQDNAAVAGTNDMHYTLAYSPYSWIPEPAVIGVQIPSIYVSNSENGQWIGLAADMNQNYDAGNYTYSTMFDLTGFDYTTAQLSLQVAADDNVDIYINGLYTGQYCIDQNWQCFVQRNQFTVNDGFVPGVNVLTFVVYNISARTGLQVVASGKAVVSN